VELPDASDRGTLRSPWRLIQPDERQRSEEMYGDGAGTSAGTDSTPAPRHIRRPTAPGTLQATTARPWRLSSFLCKRFLLPHPQPRKLYPRTGKHERAEEHLTTATAMYREMDMGFWLAPAEAEIKGWA
jgi:hypothetical protein